MLPAPSEHPGVLPAWSEMLGWDLQDFVLSWTRLETCCPSGTIQGRPRQRPGRYMGLKEPQVCELEQITGTGALEELGRDGDHLPTRWVSWWPEPHAASSLKVTLGNLCPPLHISASPPLNFMVLFLKCFERYR